MKTAVILFNGIKFPFYLADQAIAWAREQKADLQAYFLVGKEPVEGYVFPSDLDAAEKLTDRDDAEQKNIAIIRNQSSLLEDMARAKDVSCRAELLRDPSLETVLEKSEEAERIFIDAAYDKPGLLSATHFSLKQLIDAVSCPVEVVTAKEEATGH